MPKEKTRWPHLADLPLPPIDGNRVTVLLGADVFDLIVPLEVGTGPKSAPRAVRTALGWTATLHLPDHKLEGPDHTMKVRVTTPDETFDSRWKTESFGCKYAKELPRNVEDKRVLEIIESTTKKVDNRYQSGLLWKEVNATLSNNRMYVCMLCKTYKLFWPRNSCSLWKKHWTKIKTSLSLIKEQLIMNYRKAMRRNLHRKKLLPSNISGSSLTTYVLNPKQTRQSTKSLQCRFPLQRRRP
jgi:hypothetical protein